MQQLARTKALPAFLELVDRADRGDDLVSSYRLYILDPFDGQIVEHREFVAQDDETAVWISEGLRHSRPMELWAGASKVHRWDLIEEACGDAQQDLALPAIPFQ